MVENSSNEHGLEELLRFQKQDNQVPGKAEAIKSLRRLRLVLKFTVTNTGSVVTLPGRDLIPRYIQVVPQENNQFKSASRQD